MNWYLQIGEIAPQLFATFGLGKLRRRIGSQKAGSFSFTADGAATDSDPLAVEGTICSVLREAVPFFSGRLYRVPRRGTGSAESVEYQILDAWHDFEKNVYQQQWTTITGKDESGNPTTATEYRSECILGMDLNGEALNSGQVVQDVVTWAISVGAYCQLGNIGVEAPVPFDEVTDLPCSECIKKMLRWTPDAVAWFDYTTTPPTFNVTRRGDCQPVSLQFQGGPEALEIKALPNLVPSGVVIRYLQEGQTDGTPSVNQIVDDFPSGTDGTEYGALVMTCRLAGTNATYQKQPVKVIAIPADNSANDDGGPADDPTIVWWLRKCPWLQRFGGNQLVVTNVYGVYDVGEGDDDSTGTVQVDPTKYPSELLQGTLAAWMNVNYAKTTWSALVSYSYPESTDDYSDQDWEAVEVFGADQGGGNDLSAQVYICAKATATNAVTQTYAQLSTYDNPEPAPTGLAEQIYSSLATLQYEGQYTIANHEVAPWRLGLALNLAGGRSEWGSMNALLQEIEDNLDEGRTTLKFGAAGHLTLQDLMEQLRANRTRKISSHIKERQSGQPGDDPEVDGASYAPSDGGVSPPTNSSYPWIDYSDEQDDTGGHGLTWDALLGYGASSFAGSDGIDHSGPIEEFEISVGNDNSGWTGPDHDASDLTNVFSVVSGDDDYTNDRLWIGAMDDSGDGGSVLVKPGDPSIYLSPNLDPATDTDDDQYIHISLSDELIEIQDTAGSTAAMSIATDGSADPSLNLQHGYGGYVLANVTGGSGGEPTSAAIECYNGDQYATLSGTQLEIVDDDTSSTMVLASESLILTTSGERQFQLSANLLTFGGDGSYFEQGALFLKGDGTGSIYLEADAVDAGKQVTLITVTISGANYKLLGYSD